MLPHPTVLTVLDAAYQPCPGFGTVCTKMRWAPGSGHVPRGFAGAFGSPDRVRLVLVTAEPGDPYPWETYPTGPAPRNILEAACASVFRALETGNDLYHKNLRYILDGCFPGMPFRKQFERVWITDSVLCSAPREGSNVPAVLRGAARLQPKARASELGPRHRSVHQAALNRGVETAPPRRERESNDARAVARRTAATPTGERAVMWLRPAGPAPARGTASAAGSGAVEQGWANAAKQSIMGTT